MEVPKKRSGLGAIFSGNCFPCFSSSIRDTSQLRLLCSYGGKVTSVDSSNPRYIGGENRIVTVDRPLCSAGKLFDQLSATLLDGRSFTLKYHLSVARSLVSVSSDEDLHNMIKAFELSSSSSSSSKSQYLRVFLFTEGSKEPSYCLDEKKEEPKKEEQMAYLPGPYSLPGPVGFSTGRGKESGNGEYGKLRITCRYGGQFYFYPCRNYQSYFGGDNRVVVMDPPPSLSAFFGHLSRTLFNGSTDSFTLKYQSPREGVDCLISLSTDEDLENMIQLHRSLSSLLPNGFSVRLFLFPNSDGRSEQEQRDGSNVDVRSTEEPVLNPAMIRVVPDPDCRFHMHQVQNSGYLKFVRSENLHLDHATGLPLVPSCSPSNTQQPCISSKTSADLLPIPTMAPVSTASAGFKGSDASAGFP